MEEVVIAESMEDVDDAVEQENWSTYVTIGTEDSACWQAANNAKVAVAAVIIVLVPDEELARDVRERFGMDDADVAAALGFGDDVNGRLDADRAASPSAVARAMSDAQNA